MSRSHRSIQAQVIILSLAFTALIALSVFLASIVSLYHSTLRATTRSAEYNLQTLANTLRQNVQEIDSLADWCTVDSTLRNFVFGIRSDRQLLDVYNTLLNKYSSQYTARYLCRLVVTDGDRQLIQQGTMVSQSLPLTAERLEQLPGFAGGGSEDSWTMLAEDPLTYNHKLMIPVIRTMTRMQSSAKVYLMVSSDMITDAMRDYALNEGCDLFWLMNGSAWRLENGALQPVAPEDWQPEEAQDLRRYELLDSQTRLYACGDRTLVAYPVGYHDLYVAQTLPDAVIAEQFPDMLMPLLWALAAILLLGVVLAMLLRHVIAVPVQALQEQLHRISSGDFTANPAIEWHNEMGDIGRGINGLSRSVSTLMQKRLDDELQKKDLEYRMLQNQINPHFIYNTLFSIKCMVDMHRNEDAAAMLSLFIQNLRGVLSNRREMVTVAEQMESLKQYLTLQRYRYDNGFDTLIEYDDQAARCLLPKLLVQPLVENALQHGIDPQGRDGMITVIARRQGDAVCIEVEDNGAGMTPERVRQVMETPDAADRPHLGIRNVNDRIRLHYGPAWGLQIESAPGQGTRITLRIPAREEGADGTKEERLC